MKDTVKIPKPILARIQEHFDQLVPKCLFLVNQDTKPNKVYHIPASTAVKDNIYIAFKIVKDENYSCDYFLDANGYTEHRRYFLATDEVELLPNYEMQLDDLEIDDPAFDYDEHKRVMTYNSGVRKMLISKGFIKR